MLIPITNDPRDYAWGGVDAVAALLGLDSTGGPEAELWLGTHPGSPARIVATGQPLTELAGELPYLMKVLAAAEPLSLQVHPDAKQAADGYAREQAAGIPIDAPERVYRDPYAKTEIILAVSDRFEAQAGFRPAGEAAERVAELAAGTTAVDAATTLRMRLVDDAAVGDAFLWLLSDDEPARQTVAALLAVIPDRAVDYPVQARLHSLYPGDPGVVASLLLGHVVLRRGEALAVAPGTIHGYLSGIGIELLTASDNVVRGGLTPKHIDRGELARLLTRAATPPTLVPGRPTAAGIEYAPPTGAGQPPPFRLHRVERDARIPLDGPAIVLCVAGAFDLSGAAGGIRLARGDAAYASAEETVLEIVGEGELYLAH